ncbi:ribokinase [Streptomyces sp. IB2014 016-6]|uniref:ribokinase n=1 Tax=Streptomyces sp. IB2014 016-6 TaxID=2517818 RepID=UPI0011C83B94|nr:ribokinase [Streptomyces sp. IB2014 016-6]TXL86419.1 ribokinase [Streptomyces sp. IB2014 016-6]
MPTTVFVVGSLNADQLLEVPAFPAAGETVLASDVLITAGGKGGNQAVAASRAGAAVTMIGALGDDAHGRLVRRALTESGVDTGWVVTADGTHTGTAVVAVEAGGENRIIVASGANARLTRRDVESGLASAAPGDLVLLQLETPVEVVAHAARFAKERGATVVLNAAPAPADAGCLSADIDLLVVNEVEMRAVAGLVGADETGTGERGEGRDTAGTVLTTSRALDCVVVCTTGADGAYVNTGDRVVHIPAVRVTAVDTTAAGDTYTGYLAAALARGESDLPAALATASAAAAVTVTRRGAMASIPYADEIGEARAISDATGTTDTTCVTGGTDINELTTKG